MINQQNMNYTPFKIPENLLLGSATAATHIEGGEQDHNWYRWSELGNIKDGSHCKVACDHINRIESDVDLIKGINNETYRLGVEWSRIEPEEGKFSEEGIAIYRKEIKLLLANNIKPLVTLWHFSNPLWMEDDGGWVNPKAVQRFLSFSKYVVDQLGDLVEDWITLNEPNVYSTFGYFEGIWPPGKQGDLKGYFAAAKHFALAHLHAYEQIHEQLKAKGSKNPKVGVAHHLRIFDPANKSWLSKMAVNLIGRLFQNIFLESMTKGNFLFPLRSGGFKASRTHYADFIGINYYSRDIIKGVLNPATLFGDRLLKENAPLNDLEWEIYPEGLYRICKQVYDKYQRPIFITENGTCDAADNFRTKFIYDHLKVLSKAINDGIDIQRYYHWTLLDNFEWAEGNSARFGLYHNNFETQERTLRKSGEFYAGICEEKVVSAAMIETFLK